ncbi:UV-endonuclease UvdE-domain-containing protein [Echria macrotheca]|uniref:UV-endonuclease UvdE-domain-containing protein n=1 Tax=Echria macrotheca TaxID=438768 RepID=A0AAJ0B2K4_9PEZI|nr:UV-endonuclease UvdE-domain-containing protein [Echria macrotheca]
MPRKSAAQESPSQLEDVRGVQRDQSARTRPEVHLRRSNRRLGENAEEARQEDKTREIQGKVLGIRPGDGKIDENDTQGRKEMQKEGVQMAIEGLVRMERRLMRATKRQKLKVEHTTYEDVPAIAEEEENGPEGMSAAQLGKTEPMKKSQAVKSNRKSPKAQEAEEGELERELDRYSDALDGEYKDVATMETEDIPELPDRGAARPPAVNSDYLPLPWKGRLGYACLNTYLRSAKPSVFSSRTCRLSSILDHRHPLADPSLPEHSSKNRPDKSQEPDPKLGEKFVEALGLANARDIVKMLRWNDKYGIKFMRLSSEMFPFASHAEHGYKLAPFASEVLAEAGRVAAELGHRLTMHPGQFTQLGSPRKQVIDASIRDLEYHDELLTLLRLPEQQNRDAVMVIHMGGTYGDKAATLARFRENYKGLSDSIKARLVLENDDVAWSVHDLLPICEELNIPLVLDYHHHNIVFDSSRCREGTFDISQPEIMERIAATWRRKGIKQKMHYSEPCAGAMTARDRRKHSPRVKTLPPCPPDMDLMIEAKDKEQAVFELMRTFKLPGFERINDMIPHERPDESRPAPKPTRKKSVKGNGKRKRAGVEEEGTRSSGPMDVDMGNDDRSAGDAEALMGGLEISDAEFGMGGAENRVYWPPGREDWLKPIKRGAKTKINDGED